MPPRTRIQLIWIVVCSSLTRAVVPCKALQPAVQESLAMDAARHGPRARHPAPLISSQPRGATEQWPLGSSLAATLSSVRVQHPGPGRSQAPSTHPSGQASNLSQQSGWPHWLLVRSPAFEEVKAAWTRARRPARVRKRGAAKLDAWKDTTSPDSDTASASQETIIHRSTQTTPDGVCLDPPGIHLITCT